MSHLIVVGSKECPIKTVVLILTDPDFLPLFDTNWTTVAAELETDELKVKEWKQNRLLNKDSLRDILSDLISFWVARNGSDAKLNYLISALSKHGLKSCSDYLKKKFYPENQKSVNYCQVPQHISKYISSLSRSQRNVVILSTLDVSITLNKIRGNLKPCSIYNSFEAFLSGMSEEDKNIPKSNQEIYHNVILNVTLTEMEDVIEEALNYEDCHSLFILTFKSVNDVQSFLDKKYASSSNLQLKIHLFKDNMDWNDLTPKFKYEIRKTVEKQVDMTLRRENLHKMICGQILVDAINGEKLPLFKNNIPPGLTYYIERTVISRNILDKEILFKQQGSDIYAFMGIDRIELSGFVKTQMTENSSKLIKSKEANDIHYLILDDINHFSKLSERITDPLHLIDFKDGKFKWRKSSCGIHSVQKQSVSQSDQDFLNERDFLGEIFPRNDTDQVICISDSPGMGKSIILEEIARQLVIFSPDRVVGLLILSELINSIKKHSDSKCNVDNLPVLKSSLEELLCKNELEKEILSFKLQSTSISVELLLDGLDEVNPSDIPFTLETIEFLKTLNSIRIWITTRPHLLSDLEKSLNVLGYNIQPFSEEHQIKFLQRFWKAKNQILNENSLTAFAQHCLQTLKSNMKAGDHDIAGIPLQCRLLAEVYEEDAIATSSSGISHTESSDVFNLEANSMPKLYERLIEKKLQKYRSTYGIPKLRTNFLKQIHCQLAMELIFPEQFKKLANSKLITFPEESQLDELLNLGILEKCGGSTHPKFIHRTFAEYFAALFIVNQLIIFSHEDSNSPSSQIDAVELYNFLFSEFLRCSEIKLTVYKFQDKSSYEFLHPVVCYFFNYLFTDNIKVSINKESFLTLNTSIEPIIHACSHFNLPNILNLFQTHIEVDSNLQKKFDSDYLQIAMSYYDLEFAKIAFPYFLKFYEFTPDIQSKLLRYAVKSGDVSKVEYLINVKQLRGSVEVLAAGLEDLLHNCVQNSCDDSEILITQKIKVIRLLTNINKSLLEQREYTKTPLLEDAVHIKLLLELIKSGADVLATDDDGNTVLHMHHAQWSYIGRIQLSSGEYSQLIEAISLDKLKELVKIVNSNGLTPLSSLLQYFNKNPEERTLQKFKEAGADFNEVVEGCSLLAVAIKSGRSGYTVRHLIDKGADPFWKWEGDGDTKGESQKKTLLDFAAQFGNKEAVQLLIEEVEMKVNGNYWNGSTPLDYLISGNSEEISQEAFYETAMELRKLGGRLVTSDQLPLHVAASAGNIGALRFLMEPGNLNLNSEDEELNTPLHLAAGIDSASPRNFETVKFLIEHGANPNLRNRNGDNPLNCVCKCERLQIKTFNYLKYFTISKKINPEAATSLGRSLIYDNQVDNEKFHELITECSDNGGDLNVQSPRVTRDYILHTVVRKRLIRTLNFMISRNVTLNCQNSNNRSPLHILSGSPWGNMTLTSMEILINAGADVYLKDSKGRTFLYVLLREPLNEVSPSDFHQLAVCLLQNRYQNLFNLPNDTDAITIFHMAVKRIQLEEQTLKLLSSYEDINFNVLDKHGSSLLYYATHGNQKTEFLSLLIKYGVDIKKLIDGRDWALHRVAYAGESQTLRFLLEDLKIDVNAVDKQGNTALHTLIEWWNEENMVDKAKILIANGAKVNIKNKEGLTPFDKALKVFRIVNKELQQLLKSH